MDQGKVGRMIATLRRQRHWTQEALGEMLGVTNKTISRWENGNYMPDIEMLSLLSQLFQVSMEELLAGERRAEEPPATIAEEPLAVRQKASIFPLEARRAYWKGKWRQEHRALLLLPLGMVLATAAAALLRHEPWWMALGALAACLAYGYQNNRMMSYVEMHLFDENKGDNTKTARG